MGDMAEGILNGDFDEQTGEYIGNGQGFPRTLQRNRIEQISKELFGIKNYLLKIDIGNWQETMQEYARSALNKQYPNNDVLAIEIQRDFGGFVKWVKENRNNFKWK